MALVSDGGNVAARVYTFVVTCGGALAVILGLASAPGSQGVRWLPLVVLQLCAAALRGGGFQSRTGAENDQRLLQPLDRVLSDFFTLSGLLVFSPQIATLVAFSEAPSANSEPGTRGWRPDWFQLTLPALVALPCGWIFYRYFGDALSGSATEPVLSARFLAGLILCALLMDGLRVALSSFRFWLRDGGSLADQFKNRFWILGPGALAAALSGSTYALFQDRYLLIVVMAAPVILVLYSRNRASNQRLLSLIESQEFLQSSFDGLSAHIAVMDESGRIVATNQAWRVSGDRGRLFGPTSLVGSDYPGLLRGGLRERVAASARLADGVRDVLSRERDSFSLTYNCHPSDPDSWYIARVSRLRSESPFRVVVSHQDITDQKLSEARLRESEARYRSFFEDDLTGDFVADGTGILLDCNPAFARILGFASPEQAVGANFFSFFPEPEEADQVREALHLQGRLEYQEAQLESADGRSLHIVANLSAQRSGSSLTEIKGYFFDDTRRKKLEAELLQTQKMEAVGQLAGGIAHDFNNILMVVTGYGEFLRDSFSDHRVLAQEAEMLLQAAQQAGKLTSKLLAFSRRQVVRSIVLDLNKTVAEMALMLGPMIGEDVELSTELSSDACLIRIDAGQLEQLILDLAVNAREAMPKGGRLRLETRRLEPPETDAESGDKDGWVCLRVKDTGVGMNQEVLSRVFEPFFTTKEKSRGAGLGLSTAYGIAQQCGGRIEISSQPGAGASVEVYFPAADPAPTVESKRVPTAATAGATILVAEDQDDIRRIIREVLASAGYHVLAASDGLEALALADSLSEPVDLLLTDLVMPGLGGWELAKTLRGKQRHGRLKILFMSSFLGDKESLEAAVASGMESFLPKPFSSETLLAKIGEILGARVKSQENKSPKPIKSGKPKTR